MYVEILGTTTYGAVGAVQFRERRFDQDTKEASGFLCQGYITWQEQVDGWMGGWAPGDCNEIDLRQVTRRRKHLAQMRQWARLK